MITAPVYQYAQPQQVYMPQHIIQPAPIMVPHHFQQPQPQQPLPEPVYTRWPSSPFEKSKFLASFLAFPFLPAPLGWLGCHKCYLSGTFSPFTCCDFFGGVCKEVDSLNKTKRAEYYRQMRQSDFEGWRRLALVHSPASVSSMG
jgi:hypothetical protein